MNVKGFDVGKTVRVKADFAVDGQEYLNKHELTPMDRAVGVKTGAVGVVVEHRLKDWNDGLFVYVNLGPKLPNYAFHPEQLEIAELN